jgi:hypothetical protein
VTAVSSPDLATWLLEQVAADERLAAAQQGAPASCPRWEYRPNGHPERGVYEEGRIYLVIGDEHAPRVLLEHIATWDPARVLAECDVKRRIIAQHEPEDCWCGEDATELIPRPATGRACSHLRLLALPYSDRPGYREEWRPA